MWTFSSRPYAFHRSTISFARLLKKNLSNSNGEYAFAVQTTSFKFGREIVERELGEEAKSLGLKRVALFTDVRISKLPFVELALKSLKRSEIDAKVFDEVSVEPTDVSFKEATKFAAEGRFDGFISIGGGSVMDTCKAANLYSTYPPNDFLDYVNAPIGKALSPPGQLKPHISVPTTTGTGSELTGFAVFDLLSMKAKTGIGHRYLIPTTALIDPLVTQTIPSNVVASSGFDVICHAIESFTARPYYSRAAPLHPSKRPLHQGANWYSDVGCLEALRITSKYFLRAVNDSSDLEAREQMLFAATLAGSCMGNAGTHLPHGMSYPVSGLVRDFYVDGYPNKSPIIPHGMSVILHAPSVFRYIASVNPERILKAAECLGASTKDADLKDAGEILAQKLISLMKATKMPNGLSAVGYEKEDIPLLVQGAWPQKRVIDNAPIKVTQEVLSNIYENAYSYW